MILLGLGNDITDIRRVARSIERYGERYLQRVFTETEREKSDGRFRRAESYAKRWAAKEACAKALGTGFSCGVFHKDLGVVNLPGGKPSMILTGGAADRLQAITPSGMTARIELTITDEYPYAQAIVMITAMPGEGWPFSV